MSTSNNDRRAAASRRLVPVLALTVGLLLVLAGAARATVYGPAGVFNAGGILTGGVAIDQDTGEVYVADYLKGPKLEFVPGYIAQFDAQGAPGNPVTIGANLYKGVAFDQSSGHATSGDVFGFTAGGEVTVFDPSTGATVGTPFSVAAGGAPSIALDAASDVYVPNEGAGVVEEYDSTGTLLATFDCSSCPGGPFNGPKAVAIDGAGNVFVADSGNDRVMKLAPSDPHGTAASVFYTGAASALAIDPANGHVFIGGDDGEGFHVTEHDSSGAQVADLGEGFFENLFGWDQIAVSAATGDVYVTDSETGASPGEVVSNVYILAPLPAPAAATGAASAVTQITATLNATVDPEGAVTSDCHLEWGTDTSYSSGRVPCSPEPYAASSSVAVSVSIGGLAPNTTYHFRVVEQTEAGEADGTDQTFATLSNATVPVAGGGQVAVVSSPPPSPATCQTDASLCAKPRTPVTCKKGHVKQKVHGRAKCVKKKPSHRKRKRAPKKKKHR